MAVNIVAPPATLKPAQAYSKALIIDYREGWNGKQKLQLSFFGYRKEHLFKVPNRVAQSFSLLSW